MIGMDLNGLVIFREILEDPLIRELECIREGKESGASARAIRILLEEELGLREYLARLLATTENPLTLALEKGTGREELREAALKEMQVVAGLGSLAGELVKKYPQWGFLVEGSGNSVWKEMSAVLASPEKLLGFIGEHCRVRGAGLLGMYPGFVYDGTLKPLKGTADFPLSRLIGYREQIEALKRNTEAFLSGKPALNALLYGEKGTGKSSTVRGLLPQYGPRGLKIIEVGKHHLGLLDGLLALLRNRGGRYIIFLDDLSFEDYEHDYKTLKAVIEGELTGRAGNVLVYATSNRRHLIRENWADRLDERGEIHRSDSMEEKLSLADRFGLLLTYQGLNRKQYLEMVETMAGRTGIRLAPEELRRRAMLWEISGHGMSGRSAEQFVVSLIGEGVEYERETEGGHLPDGDGTR